MVLPHVSDIKFTNDWEDDSKSYIISVLPHTSDSQLAGMTPTFDHAYIYEIHIFVKSISEEEPEEIGDIELELERILVEDPTALLPYHGISYIHILDFRREYDTDNTVTDFHYVMDIEVMLRKFLT